ncbi:mRNA decay protein [Coemansia biformis]|uniref:mRNA decay protein n=1 Tax=Coemansia biformis TaxID=1286918 RepID=A0A9W8CVW2_9FUNG|nr:mRNA decay protein [Coemansia biformis]
MIAPVSFAQLLRRLPTMTTKDEVDQAAADFCYVNTRTNRKALAAALLDAPRRQMFVIPHYGRFLATLHPFFPDIGEAVVDELSRDFGWLARKRFKGLLDARLKNARYIAELTKFRVAPLHVSFRCARTLLEQFHVQNIEVLCALLDGCGRFLRTQPQTASRVESLLEILIRKRRVLNLDDRTMLLIENTCSACQPHRAREAAPAKFRTPYERYIRKLVYEDLTDGTVDAVCQRLRRLPWGDGTGDDAQRVRHALVCCFAKVWKLRHATIRPAAAALAALRRLHPWFGVSVVDAVVENIKLGLERNTFEHSQRRIAEALYMGEMFRYGAVGANDVLDLVRLFLGFGHREPLPLPGRSCELDPSSSYFRIRLICTLLLACWPQINSVGTQQALAGIAQHLQMYILAKDQPLPVDIDYNVDSLFETVFAGTMRFESWDQAAQVAAMAAQRPMQPTSGTQPAGVDAGQATPCSLPVPASPAQPLASGEIHAARGGAADTSSVREEANSEGCREPGPEDGSISGAGSTESDGNDASAEHAVVDYDAEMYEARRQREALEALIDREEEESLEREFNKLMLESSDVRRAEHTNKLDVGIPMSLMGRSLVLQPAAPAEHAAGGGQAAGDGESGGGSDAIRFSLLTGKKQRPVIHEVDIPAESRMAQSLRQQEELAMREKAHLKRIVLDYERREANEERRLYERELAARRAGAFPGGSGGGGGDGTLAGGSAAARPIVPGATFVSRPSPAASRRRQRVTAVAVQRDQQQQQQRRAGAHPGIPDRFL